MSSENSVKYNNLLKRGTNVSQQQKYVKEMRPTVKENDYNRGYIFRYFAQKSNDPNGKISEIDRRQYVSWFSGFGGIKRSYYTVLKIEWKVTGNKNEVIVSNFNSINNGRDIIKTLPNKLNNLLEFWKKNEVLDMDEKVTYLEAKRMMQNDN